MSIESEINRIRANVVDAYAALFAKGATPPLVQNTTNLKSTIESIQGGEAMSIETVRAICYVPSDFERNYMELEYIESTGTQYIDTGFVPNQDTRVLCKAVFSVGTTTRFLFGARQSQTSRQFMFAGSSNGYYLSGYGSASASFDTAFNSSCPIVVDKNKSITTITLLDGTSGQVEGATTSFTAPNNMVLFGCNTAGTVAKGSARIYFCKIYDNGTLVRDFVPCRKKSSGTVGLYDLVSQRFFGNAGTDSFIAGHKLPDGYTRLSYIESTGAQYIDTGFVPNQDTRMVLDFAATDVSVTNNFAGTRQSTTAKAFAFSTISSKWRFGYNTASTNTKVAADTNRHIADFNGNVLSVDGTTVYTATAAEFEGYGNIWIGAINASNGTQWGMAKYYSCQIYDNGNLVRNFTPCINPDGVYGLYDMENNQFYGNAGEGSFTAGDAVA